MAPARKQQTRNGGQLMKYDIRMLAALNSGNGNVWRHNIKAI